MRLAAGLALALVAAPADAAQFAAGQRWTCVTDQGREAYLAILAVEGRAVTFSWGVRDPSRPDLDRLCVKRDALSVEEMSDFCRLLGGEYSAGHEALSRGCAAGVPVDR